MGLLNNIRYIFQIPLEWFKCVDARVFGDHPGPGIKFEPANDGSRAVMADFDVLDRRYSGGGGGTGTVTSVDNVSPDANGNVALGALTDDDIDVEGGVMSYDQNLSNLLNSSGKIAMSKLVSQTALKNVVTNSSGRLTTQTLTSGKWLKSNSDGGISTTDDTPLVPSASKTGVVYNTTGTVSYVSGLTPSGSKKVITNVTWDGATLSYTSEQWTFTKGLLTSITSNGTTVVDTPVAWTPS